MIFTIFTAYFRLLLYILKTRKELADFLGHQRARNHTIGLVPTMGALHNGHLSLIARSAAENDLSVCSIFVNPTQFTDLRDLEIYPRPVDSDIQKLEQAACDVLFMPDVAEIYPVEEHWNLGLGELEKVMEGKFRPGHYQGVTQIVKKLFELVEPVRAYFGQKDYQQFLVIKKMVRMLSVPVELICCPTLREEDGLAMSSRNIHLSPAERKEAALLSKALFMIRENSAVLDPARARAKALELLSASGRINVEYLEIADADTLEIVRNWEDAPSVIALAAAKLGQTRLIDNVFIREPGEVRRHGTS